MTGGSEPPAALDSAGFAGSGADAERLRAQGCDEMPLHGDVASVTVPGAVDGWLALHARYGRLPLADVLAEAVRIAEAGFAASPLLADRAGEVAGVEGNTDIPVRLRAGAVVQRPGTARALRAVAERGRDGFYGGEFGEGPDRARRRRVHRGRPGPAGRPAGWSRCGPRPSIMCCGRCRPRRRAT